MVTSLYYRINALETQIKCLLNSTKTICQICVESMENEHRQIHRLDKKFVKDFVKIYKLKILFFYIFCIFHVIQMITQRFCAVIITIRF